MESIVTVKKINPNILMDLHIFSIPEYEKVDFGMLSVCMYVCALC
jgi:hypothetical protein